MPSELPSPKLGIMHMNSTRFSLTRHLPSEPLRPFIRHYWIIHWNLTGHPPHDQEVIPNPCPNLVVQSGKTAVYGVSKTVHSHHLIDKGTVFGAKFHPGGLYPFYRQPLSGLTGTSVSTEDILGIQPALLESTLLQCQDPKEMIAAAERVLLSVLPDPHEEAASVGRWVEEIRQRRDITSVEHICQHAQVGKRTLQRMFKQYVGVPPKWVIKLYRLQNAAELLEEGNFEDGMKLALELGYYDQSHFIRDFKSKIGCTPEAYLRKGQPGQ